MINQGSREYQRCKRKEYELIVEQGLGSEEVWEEWEKSELPVPLFIKMIYKREGRVFVRVSDE